MDQNKYTQFRIYGLRIYVVCFVIFWLYGFLENVFPNKVFAFMDFSLIWTILARTNVVHISGIGCTKSHVNVVNLTTTLNSVPAAPSPTGAASARSPAWRPGQTFSFASSSWTDPPLPHLPPRTGRLALWVTIQHDKNIGPKNRPRVQLKRMSVPCPRRLGFVDLDLGCSTTLLGQ